MAHDPLMIIFFDGFLSDFSDHSARHKDVVVFAKSIMNKLNGHVEPVVGCYFKVNDLNILEVSLSMLEQHLAVPGIVQAFV